MKTLPSINKGKTQILSTFIYIYSSKGKNWSLSKQNVPRNITLTTSDTQEIESAQSPTKVSNM